MIGITAKKKKDIIHISLHLSSGSRTRECKSRIISNVHLLSKRISSRGDAKTGTTKKSITLSVGLT
jgi:hypothetical protein